MTWWQIALGVVINAIIIVIPISCVLFECIKTIIDNHKPNIEIKRRNQAFLKENPGLERKLCIHCSYCRWKFYHPFSRYGKHYWEFVTKQPLYCKKFGVKLENKSTLRCVSKLSENAMYYKETRNSATK